MTRSRSVVVLGLLIVLGWGWALSRAMESGRSDAWSAMLVAPALVLISVPLVVWAAHADGWRYALPVLCAALAAKLVSSLLRYYVAFDVYGGSSDSLRYHLAGAAFAEELRAGRAVASEAPVGTEFVEVFTGVVYAAVGPSLLSGFLVFGWLALWGQWFLYRAFRIALPEGRTRAYALLVLFWPSLLFWPSSVGKEALMMLAIGTTALGVARLSVARSSLPLLCAGLGLAALIRPHVALLLAGGLVLAVVVRGPRRRTLTSPVTHMVAIAAASGVVLTGVLVAARFLNVDDVGVTSLQSTLETTAERTSKGGSEFASSPVRSVGDLPAAALTVLFRPWPWEAHNGQALFAGLEAIVLLLLLALSWRRLVALPRLVVSVPYVAFAAVYLVTFVYAFSSFGNFGLLVRERTQVLPFVLMLLCLPLRAERLRPSARNQALLVRSSTP